MTDEQMRWVSEVVRRARKELPELHAKIRVIQARIGTPNELTPDGSELEELMHHLVNTQTKANAPYA